MKHSLYNYHQLYYHDYDDYHQQFVGHTVQLNSNLTLDCSDSCEFTDFFRVMHQHSCVFRVQLALLVTAHQFTRE